MRFAAPASLLAATLLSACASSASDPVARKAAALERFPETIEAGIARAETFQACSSLQSHEIVRKPRTDGRIPPTLKTSCVPKYPDDLQALGFVSKCTSTFDIDPAGVPVNLSATCDTWNDGMIDDPEPLTPIANAMFETVASKAVEAMRFVPLEEDVEGATRIGIAQPFNFAFEGQSRTRDEQADTVAEGGSPE